MARERSTSSQLLLKLLLQWKKVKPFLFEAFKINDLNFAEKKNKDLDHKKREISARHFYNRFLVMVKTQLFQFFFRVLQQNVLLERKFSLLEIFQMMLFE